MGLDETTVDPVSVHTQTLNPRSVNVALETVLEFDGKHNSRDINTIEKLQDYLNKIKKILTNNDQNRRDVLERFKFSDLLKSALQIVASFDDNDLLDVITIAINEIKKYNCKGCKFREIFENLNMRRAMSQKLVKLNDLTAKELREKINKAAETLEANTMTEEKEKILDYLDSLYVGDDIKGKMELLVAQLHQFKNRSKRSNLNLAKVINEGLRSIIFDYYTDLNANDRKELTKNLETFWYDFKNSDKVKDVSKKMLTTDPLSDSVKKFEKVNPRDISRSNIIKKNKKTKHFERKLTDSKEVNRMSSEYPKKEKLKILLRKKTDRVKKYNKKQLLRTLKTTPISMADHADSDDSDDRSGPATAEDAIEVVKSKIRSMKNSKKLKLRQRKREHEYEATDKETEHSSDIDENSDEGLHIQSFEKHKTTNSLRKRLTYYSRNETTDNTVEKTAAIPNVINRINNIEKVLHEIKSLVTLRRKANDIDEEKTEKSKTTTTNIKETESTVTTMQTTKITSPPTESESYETTTEVSKMKSTIVKVKALETKPHTTKAAIAQENDEEDTNIFAEAKTKFSKTTANNKTEPLTTKEMTMKNHKLETTMSPSFISDLISNDTRRNIKENAENKSRSTREAKLRDLEDQDININQTKRSSVKLKDIVKDKLKSIKEHDLSDMNREQRYNKHRLNNYSEDLVGDKTGKFHKFSDVKHSQEHDLEEFVSDKTKFVEENEFSSDLEGMQNRRSRNNFSDLDKEKLKFGKDHDFIDEEHQNKYKLNNLKDIKLHNMKIDDEDEWTDKEHHSKDSFKNLVRDKIESGLTDIEIMKKRHFNNFKDFSKDKLKIGEKKLTDNEIEKKYETHQVLKNKDKENDETDLDIDHMYKETRRAQFDKIIDKNSVEDKKLNKRIRAKIAGHMENLMSMKRDGKDSEKLDFNFDDPFNLKEDDFML